MLRRRLSRVGMTTSIGTRNAEQIKRPVPLISGRRAFILDHLGLTGFVPPCLALCPGSRWLTADFYLNLPGFLLFLLREGDNQNAMLVHGLGLVDVDVLG